MAARDEAVSYDQMQDGGALDELAPCRLPEPDTGRHF